MLRCNSYPEGTPPPPTTTIPAIATRDSDQAFHQLGRAQGRHHCCALTPANPAPATHTATPVLPEHLMLLPLLRAGSAPLSRGPMRPGEPVTDQPAGTRTRMSAYSSRHRRCRRRIPAPAHAPEGQDVRRAGRLGCLFFGYVRCRAELARLRSRPPRGGRNPRDRAAKGEKSQALSQPNNLGTGRGGQANPCAFITYARVAHLSATTNKARTVTAWLSCRCAFWIRLNPRRDQPDA